MKENGLIYFLVLWIVLICRVSCWPDGQQCPYHIPRGDLNLECIREPGQTCNFTCDDGYEPSISPSTITCGSDLKWNHNLLRLCEETICPRLFEGGYVGESCSRIYKATCSEFQCNPGYVKLAFEVQCEESGKWINPDRNFLACVWPDGQQCPYYIPRGDLNLKCIREPGQTCNFTCDEGYQPSISPSTITCGSDLKWNHNPKSLCQKTICPRLFEGGYVAESCSRNYKATCSEFQCNPGYVKLAFEVQCDQSGKWINPDTMSSACGSCDMQIPHGNVTWLCATKGPPCIYSCHEGYEKHHTVYRIQCSTSGQWVSWSSYLNVSAKDLCTPKPCPTVISKGAFSSTCKAVVGSACSFSCEAGYMRNTSVPELTCQTSTEWSSDLRSLCLRPDGQQCPYYIPKGDLNIECIREPGQTCDFTCDEGYQSSISPSTIACGSDLKWNHNPKSLCQETICPRLFEGGYVAESCSRKYKARCFKFQCNPGYVEFAFEVECDESGKWINRVTLSPACRSTSMSSSNVSRSTGEKSDKSDYGNLGLFLGVTLGPVTGLIIIFGIVLRIIYWSRARKLQRREPGHVGSRCLRPRANRDQNVTTLRQGPNAVDVIGTVSSFESPSYNDLYVHSFVQRTPTIPSSCNYHEPPPPYSKISIAPNEPPPTYEEVVSDPSRFNLYI